MRFNVPYISKKRITKVLTDNNNIKTARFSKQLQLKMERML